MCRGVLPVRLRGRLLRSRTDLDSCCLSRITTTLIRFVMRRRSCEALQLIWRIANCTCVGAKLCRRWDRMLGVRARTVGAIRLEPRFDELWSSYDGRLEVMLERVFLEALMMRHRILYVVKQEVMIEYDKHTRQSERMSVFLGRTCHTVSYCVISV